jgi:hypothetical protein
LKKYRIVLETKRGQYKEIHTNDFEKALRFQEKYKAFAKKHNLTWTVSLFGQGFLIESETINPTRIIAIN